MRWFLTALALALLIVGTPAIGHAADFSVYSIHRPVDLGIPGEAPPKDYYINMGSAHGLRPGSKVLAYRKVSTYETETRKFYKDLVLPIALMTIIHVEDNAAIARVEKLVPTDKTGSISPRTVVLGDIVRIPQD